MSVKLLKQSIDDVLVRYMHFTSEKLGIEFSKLHNLAFEQDISSKIKSSSTDWEGTITITASEQVENHNGCKCELIDCNKQGDIGQVIDPSACVLKINGGINALLESQDGADRLFEEQKGLIPIVDRKAKMRGQVKNKRARANLCFDTQSQEPDYENGKGRIVEYKNVPLTHSLISKYEYLIGKVENRQIKMLAEGNYYDKYEPSSKKLAQCGIGFHGDSERRIVWAFRLGSTMTLEYQWFKETKPEGKRIKIKLKHGDIYIMGDKAVGFDWKKRKIYTLRHAAGHPKYLKIKEK